MSARNQGSTQGSNQVRSDRPSDRGRTTDSVGFAEPIRHRAATGRAARGPGRRSRLAGWCLAGLCLALAVTLRAAPEDRGATDGAEHWAFQPPSRHEPPAVDDVGWPRRRIDHFILARLEEEGLQPAAAASRRTWYRRARFDLTGLPPSPGEVEAFVADSGALAHEAAVDRLLASPAFGEKWARHWLDIARYAEDQAHIVGDNKSLFYPNAYLYRDWVIDAFNADIPYDRFVRLQLAADRFEPEDDADHVALGFLGLGPKYYGRGNPAVKADEWEDRVDTVSRGFLALTVACARCHDHKYDPISTEDYYALAGVFASTRMYNRPLDSDRETEKNGQAKKPADAMHIVREGEPTDLHVFLRGDIRSKGDVVERRFLPVLCGGEAEPFQKGSGRGELAEAIVDPRNPLTARVLVNRVWARVFGRPLVETPSNFGRLGATPSHPRLLDDLAVRFVENGWSLKWLLRELLLSATYRQSSDLRDELVSRDPDNSLYARTSRRRLDIEVWRDAQLAVTGELEWRVGGPSMDPQDPDERRRTVYGRVSRLELNSMLAMFDHPDPNVHAASRAETTTPLQKLFVLNSPFMLRRAAAFRRRLEQEIPQDDTRARVRRAFALAYTRPPGERELAASVAFIEKDPAHASERLERFAHVLLASNEMLFVD